MSDSYTFLKSVSSARRIDRILIATDDIRGFLERLEKFFGYVPGEVFRETLEGKPWTDLCSLVPLADGREMKIMQPVEGRSPCRLYLEQYGPGVMGLREMVGAEDWEKWLGHIDEQAIPVLDRLGDCGLTLDLRDSLGCIVELLRAENAGEKAPSPRRIGQVCITTADIHKTAEDMCRLLGVGPWEIGHINNMTSPLLNSAQHPAGSFPKADFLAGIAYWGDLEFELIQPLEGPLPYFDYLRRRGAGFHHIKEIIGLEKWEETLEQYRAHGIGVALGGKVGPCLWSNLATEQILGFIYELGDGVEMTALPEGYGARMYPEI